MIKLSPNEAELRDFLRQRITGISTAAEDDIVDWFERYSEAQALAARIDEQKLVLKATEEALMLEATDNTNGIQNFDNWRAGRYTELQRQLLGQEGES